MFELPFREEQMKKNWNSEVSGPNNNNNKVNKSSLELQNT